jgi:environmental stress-induced protein Ves
MQLIVSADHIEPKAWRNKGGLTRDVLIWPPGSSEDQWQVRISRADITADGPFSAYTGVERWFNLLEGRGLTLKVDQQLFTVQAGNAPLVFDGGTAPECHLLDGPTLVLNFMVRATGQRSMKMANPREPWLADFACRGLYAYTSGNWSDGQQSVHLRAHTLVWQSGSDAPWHFIPDGDAHSGRAWWMGFTP